MRRLLTHLRDRLRKRADESTQQLREDLEFWYGMRPGVLTELKRRKQEVEHNARHGGAS